MHPEFTYLFAHTSHLSFYEKFTSDALVTLGTFSHLGRDHRPSAVVIDSVEFPHDTDISPASSTSGDSAVDTSVSGFGNCTLEFFFAGDVAWRAAFAIVPVPILLFTVVLVILFGTDHPAGK
jgi:hypothetical protein